MRAERERIIQLDKSRHDGQLHNRSFLQHHGPFATSNVTAGTGFEASVDELLDAVRKWEDCLRAFVATVDTNRLAAAIQDGTGPVAHAVGKRFNHLIGARGGVGYAALAYTHKLEQILTGLTETTGNLARSEEQAATGFTDGTVTS